MHRDKISIVHKGSHQAQIPSAADVHVLHLHFFAMEVAMSSCFRGYTPPPKDYGICSARSIGRDQKHSRRPWYSQMNNTSFNQGIEHYSTVAYPSVTYLYLCMNSLGFSYHYFLLFLGPMCRFIGELDLSTPKTVYFPELNFWRHWNGRPFRSWCCSIVVGGG